jgi:DNA/RNA endonuclease YhcR with UshA esterase domain
MANPNIVAVTSIYGNTSTLLISSTADPFATALVNNAASSGKVYKINSIVVANVDASVAASITIKIFSQDDLAGTGTAIASTISIPPGASLIVTDKTTSFYLLEDKSLGATASAANDLVVTCSWEEIN